jgi:hypothetical protein
MSNIQFLPTHKSSSLFICLYTMIYSGSSVMEQLTYNRMCLVQILKLSLVKCSGIARQLSVEPSASAELREWLGVMDWRFPLSSSAGLVLHRTKYI